MIAAEGVCYEERETSVTEASQNVNKVSLVVKNKQAETHWLLLRGRPPRLPFAITPPFGAEGVCSEKGDIRYKMF